MGSARTDLASYPQWNPLFTEVSGELGVGSAVTLKSVQARGRTMTVKATVLAVQPCAELRWTAGLKGIIGGEHAFILSPQAVARDLSRVSPSAA